MSSSTTSPGARLDLLDYRRRVVESYARVRRRPGDAAAWRRWRSDRDELFRGHPQSPYGADQRQRPEPLPYFSHDPALRFEVEVDPAPTQRLEIGHSADGVTPAERVGRVALTLDGVVCTLSLYWLDVYGGGLFLPFRDATNGASTYGGGRYLLDTVKGADLGGDGRRLVLDFNYAYHPSCAHDPQWSSPLAPPDNRLPVPVRAGERLRTDDGT